MNSKQRVEKILSFNQADRIPWDYWAVPEVTRRLIERFGLRDKEELLRKLEVDFRYIEGPSYIGQEYSRHGDGIMEDLWGVKRRLVTIENDGRKSVYKELAESPLQQMNSVTQIEDYHHWPKADWWDYSNMHTECKNHADYAVIYAGDRLDRPAQLKPMMYLRGMEQTFLDLV